MATSRQRQRPDRGRQGDGRWYAGMAPCTYRVVAANSRVVVECTYHHKTNRYSARNAEKLAAGLADELLTPGRFIAIGLTSSKRHRLAARIRAAVAEVRRG